MKKTTASPLLRSSAGEPQPDLPYTLTDVGGGKVFLQGLVLRPWRDHQVVLEVSTGGSTQRLVFEEGPWPRPFQLDASDLPGLTLVDSVQLVVLYLQDGMPRRMSSTLHVPLRCTGLRLRADKAWTEPVESPQAEPVTCYRVDVEGTLDLTFLDDVRSVTLAVHTAFSLGPTVVLEGPFPCAFRLADGEFTHLPLLTPRVAVLVKVQTPDGEHAEMMGVSPTAQGVVLQPNAPRPPEPDPPFKVKRPVYGNTKGPQYPPPRLSEPKK